MSVAVRDLAFRMSYMVPVGKFIRGGIKKRRKSFESESENKPYDIWTPINHKINKTQLRSTQRIHDVEAKKAA